MKKPTPHTKVTSRQLHSLPEADQQAVAEMLAKVHNQLSGETNTPESRLNILKQKAYYKAIKALTARIGNNIVGQLTLQPERSGKSYYIDNLWVDPKYRKVGVATELLAAAEKEAKSYGATQLRLGVDYDNLAARNLYDKLGFLTSSMLLSKDLGARSAAPGLQP